MLRLVVVASLVFAGACRYSLEDGPAAPVDSAVDAPLSPSCMESLTNQNLAFIEDKIFKQSCVFSGCHNGQNSDAGRIDLRTGMSHAHLVNFDSVLDPTRKLVVAGQPSQSYLLMMMKHITPENMSPPASPPPTDIGYMPQNAGGAILCVEKRDAIERWITAGALNN